MRGVGIVSNASRDVMEDGKEECCLKDHQVSKISFEREMNKASSRWCFESDIVDWLPTVRLTKISPYLNSLDSLTKEGSFCHMMKVWRRYYVTKSGICINLIEDIPEAGGQNCIWSAGIVMAEWFQCIQCDISFHGAKVLELGSGCGLTGMCLSSLGCEVYCTEQISCLPYLKKNASINPDIPIIIHQLHWTNTCDNNLFDIAFGCDITYDTKNFKSIFTTISKSLKVGGIFLLCHDNDSCPLSARAERMLNEEAITFHYSMCEIDYEHMIPKEYYSRKVKLWKLIRLE